MIVVVKVVMMGEVVVLLMKIDGDYDGSGNSVGDDSSVGIGNDG